MIARALTLAGGLAGAATTSQFPEFSQQYLQRLGGAVDALSVVVADFDASAKAAGLSRQEALEQMQGTEFLDSRSADVTRTFSRYDRLSADLETLQGEGPFMRAYRGASMTDPQIARAAWEVFQPALPLNIAGGVFAGIGFVLGGLVLSLVLGVLRWPFRRRKGAEVA